MELWTGVLSRWKYHWPDLKIVGLFQQNSFLNSLKKPLKTLLSINAGVFTSLLIPHLSSSLTDYLPSLNLLCHSKTDARFMQDAPNAVWSIPFVSVAFFPSLNHHFIAYRSSKVSLLKFTSNDNQAWVRCIPIPPVAVDLNLKSSTLVSHLIRCIAITSWIVYDNLKCPYEKVWKLIVCTSY